MNLDQLWLVLPSQLNGASGMLSTSHWTSVLEQFGSQGGRELLLAGEEPLIFPGFWILVRRAVAAGIPRISVLVSGKLLEPWVKREMVERGVHVLVALDSLNPEVHHAMHGPGSHARALDAIDGFLRQGLAERLGILATVTWVNRQEVADLAAWAVDRGLSRFLWSTIPDGGWPAPSLEALRLTPQEKTELCRSMAGVRKSLSTNCYIGPLDQADDPEGAAFPRLLRVESDGEAFLGLSGNEGRIGNVRRALVQDMLQRVAQAAGD